MRDAIDLIIENGIMPILPVGRAEGIEVACRAVETTELPVIEILQRNPEAEKALRIAAKAKKTARIGAGTVCNLEHCKKVLDMGADFIVSPGFDKRTVDYCVKRNVPVIPGVCTPTEILAAANAGVRLAKFFPFFEMGGEKYFNAITAPFAGIRFVLSGYLAREHLMYLRNKKCAAIGGVWMFCSEEDMTLKDEAAISGILGGSIEEARRFKTGAAASNTL